ncbi:MAG: replication endonuclease, partial [Motiliproteus sp.]
MTSVLDAALEKSHLVPVDQKWVTKRVGRFPLAWQPTVESEYVHIWEKAGFSDANVRLRELSDQMLLPNTGLMVSSDRKVVEGYAEVISKRLEMEFTDFKKRTGDLIFSVNCVKDEVVKRGLTFPLDLEKEYTKEQLIAALARVFDPHWWRRKIAVIQGRKLEQIARDLKLVCRHKQVYCSNQTVSNRKGQLSRNKRMLEGLEVVSDTDDVLSLIDCVEASVANPENRRAELMARMRGFEDVANHLGHQGIFFTLTAPSKFHAIHSKGYQNKKHQGGDPREVQQYLCRVWSEVRAAWDRDGIKTYGFRVVEPHHDG